MKELKVVIVFFLFFSGLSPQWLVAQQFGGGFKSGLTGSEVSGDNLAGPDKLGWFAAAFTNVPVRSHSKIQLELLFIQKGSRSKPNEKNNYYDYRFSLQYVEVPFILIMGFPPEASSKFVGGFSVEAGLSVAMLVAAVETENDLELDLSALKPYKEAELNVLLGLYYPVGERFSFHFRFSQGLTPLRPHLGATQTWYNRGQYNTVWTFGLSWAVL